MHQLQWRGQAAGPWTIAQIREALASGEVHSLYQIHVEGRWLPLREHLESIDADELGRRATQLGESLRQRDTQKVEPVKAAGRRRLGFDGPVSKPNPFGRPPPVFVKSASGIPSLMPEASADAASSGLDAAPTCWLGVAAFVVSCACFVPYLNLVAWVPAIVLGHLALGQVRRQPQLEGRGLAVGALVIGYATLAFAFITAALAPDLFHRIFPIGDA